MSLLFLHNNRPQSALYLRSKHLTLASSSSSCTTTSIKCQFVMTLFAKNNRRPHFFWDSLFFSLKDDWLLLLMLLMKNTSLILTGSNLQVVGECWNNITSLKCRLTSANRKTSAAKSRITNMSAKRNVTVIKIKVSGLQTNGSSVGHNCQMYYALTSFHLSSKVSPVPCGCQRPI